MSCETETSINYPDGGYDYPKKVGDSSYYFYPLRDVISRRDSFYKAFEYITYRAFDEPNLSLAFKGEDVFRFYYQGFKRLPFIIILTKGKLVIKKGKQQIYYDEDTTRVTPLERLHYRILRYRFPLQEQDYSFSPAYKKRIDSLIRLYPQLLDPAYLKYLIQKIVVPAKKKFSYALEEHSIPFKEYHRLVSIINDSGYWKLPFRIDCDGDVSDGADYALEASTQRKYKVVISHSCPYDKTKFSEICQEIIKYAGLDKGNGPGREIQLVWNPIIRFVPAPDTVQEVIIENIREEPTKKDSSVNKKRKNN